MNSRRFKAALVVSANLFFSIGVTAETVRIPVGQGAEVWHGKTPAHGQTKPQVEAEFGNPTLTEGPNGEPPIYFWEYPDFTVYFESDHVIHAVIKRRSKSE